MDAGADTTRAVRVSDEGHKGAFDDTPLVFAELLLNGKNVKRKDATESELHSLEAIRRMLMTVEAVHAASWLWATDAPSITHAASESAGRVIKATSTPLISMLPTLRRRTAQPRVILAALFRWVVSDADL